MKDIIYVENHFFVSIKNESIKLKSRVDNTEKYYLLDDIEAIIFDSPKSYLSQNLIIKCVEWNILLLFCDLKHSPLTEVVSQYGRTQRLHRLQCQLQLLSKTKDRIWKKIVKSKILNQAKCLQNNNRSSQSVAQLHEYAKNVITGDRSNREAVAARLYFQSLFGKQFKRGRYEDTINSTLNYGYAILRSLIKKELALHGLEMSMGIKHHSRENAYNLADDIIETYRPFVDSMAYDLCVIKNMTFFGYEEKKKVLLCLFENCLIDKKIVKLTDSIKMTVQSLIRCYEQNTPTPLLLPRIIEVGN